MVSVRYPTVFLMSNFALEPVECLHLMLKGDKQTWGSVMNNGDRDTELYHYIANGGDPEKYVKGRVKREAAESFLDGLEVAFNASTKALNDDDEAEKVGEFFLRDSWFKDEIPEEVHREAYQQALNIYTDQKAEYETNVKNWDENVLFRNTWKDNSEKLSVNLRKDAHGNWKTVSHGDDLLGVTLAKPQRNLKHINWADFEKEVANNVKVYKRDDYNMYYGLEEKEFDVTLGGETVRVKISGEYQGDWESKKEWVKTSGFYDDIWESMKADDTKYVLSQEHLKFELSNKEGEVFFCQDEVQFSPIGSGMVEYCDGSSSVDKFTANFDDILQRQDDDVLMTHLTTVNNPAMTWFFDNDHKKSSNDAFFENTSEPVKCQYLKQNEEFFKLFDTPDKFIDFIIAKKGPYSKPSVGLNGQIAFHTDDSGDGCQENCGKCMAISAIIVIVVLVIIVIVGLFSK